MALLKCKMCGGDLEIIEGSTVCVCEYCGTRQTVPSTDNEKLIRLFERANRLRMACEFDKAYGVYQAITEEFTTEAEAYWGLVLCKYGIEYVDDPKTAKKIPTCHRSSFDSIFDDSDFEQALENADAVSREVYRAEAKVIEEIRKCIVEISSKEEPYDIFICYKETDEKGDRTIDSVIAQDVYDALVEKKYKVFFSRITLEDKLGMEYEPYIFSALHSAKVMLVFGTNYEYFNAVWVKNEWARFLKLIEQDSTKVLIPCFKGIDAYDMPKEFARLQAQDMGKVGAIQDLLRGIGKLINRKEEKVVVQETMRSTSLGSFAEPLVIRAYEFLEQRDYLKAKEFFEKALDYDPKNEKALLGELLVEFNVTSVEELISGKRNYRNSLNYTKLLSCCSSETKERLQNGIKQVYEGLLEEGKLCLRSQSFDTANKYFDRALELDSTSEGALIGKLLAEFSAASIDGLAQGEFFHRSQNYANLLSYASKETKEKLKKITEQIKSSYIDRAEECLQNGMFSVATELCQEVLECEPRNERALICKFLAECKVKEIAELENELELFNRKASYNDLIDICSEENKQELENTYEVAIENLLVAVNKCLMTENYFTVQKYAGILLEENKKAEAHLALLLADFEVSSLNELSEADKIISSNANYKALMSIGSEELKAQLTKCDQRIRKNIATKKRNKKIIIWTSICLALIFTVVITVVLLMHYNSDAYLYGANEVGNGVEITMENGGLEDLIENGHLEIPSEIDGKLVVKIGDSAFLNCTELKSVTIPDSVTSIGEAAFKNCKALESVEIPSKVTVIYSSAFEGCKSLKSVKLPNSLTVIFENAFNGCVGLEKVELPNVTSIGYRAFYGCSNVKEVVLSSDISYIGTSVFDGCFNIKKLTAPTSIIHAIPKTALQTVVINGGDEILPSAFYNCTPLKSVTMSDSIKIIGDNAFDSCTNLEEITMGNNVTKIGEYAFYGCAGLASIQIPNSVTSIGEYAFADCTRLTSVEIPSTDVIIGSDAFSGSTNIREATVSTYVLSSLSLGNLEKLVITGGTEIKEYALLNCSNLTSVTLPSSITSIGNHAFCGCTGLKSIVIPNGVTSIADVAFYNCVNLTSITIPDSVTSIGENAFEGCRGLASIVIPDSVTVIKNFAFYNCTALTIYCEAPSEPFGWDTYWNSSSCPVRWGYTGN